VLIRVVAAAALSLLLTSSAWAAPARTSAGALRAGAASVELKLPAGVPLAGYGSVRRRLLVPDLLGRHPHAFWFKPSDGARDPIMARALVIETPGTRVLWVTTDLVAVDHAFTTDLAKRLAAEGLTYAAIILSASHTHSGPGAFVASALFELLVMDRLDRTVRGLLLDGALAAVRLAERRKTAARVGARTVTAPPVAKSRLDLPLDREMTLLKFVGRDGRPIAVVWNFAIHGTMLGPKNLLLSGDVMGVASRALERALGVPARFVNGAVGDVSPRRHGDAAADEVGGQLASVVAGAWPRVAVRDHGDLRTTRDRIDLPAPFVSAHNCTRGWAPSFLAIPLRSALPRAADLVAVALGDIAWVAIPGELQAALGVAVKEAGRRHFSTVFVAGLSNGYLGYLLTAEAYQRPGYIECGSLYGEGAGQRVVDAAVVLLGKLGASRYGAAASRRASTDFLRAAVLR
jgi:hypothetical protein